MIESVMVWNELNNVAHWHGGDRAGDDRPVEDPDFRIGFGMIRAAAERLRDRHPEVERVFPGLAPMDPTFLERAHAAGALAPFDTIAGHNFWFDFGPASRAGESSLERLGATARALLVTVERLTGRSSPFIFSEIGVSSFAGDGFQERATAQTLRVLDDFIDERPDTRATWYSLFDLPEEYMVTSRYRPDSHGEVRHRKFGLYRYLDGAFRPKRAAEAFAHRPHPDRIGITQWFRMPWPDPERGLSLEDATELSYRSLEAAPPLLRQLGVEWLRMNITWCDWYAAEAGELDTGFRWFDDLVGALSEFRLLVTIFQTPPQLVRTPDRYAAGSVPREGEEAGLADAVVAIVDRYARADRPAG